MEYEELNGKPDSLKRYAKICAKCCDQAEHILREQEDTSLITDLAKQVIYYGRHLGQFEHMLNDAYSATSRMGKCLFEHPRLLLELKETEYEILRYIEAVQQHELAITEDLRHEIAQLKANIKAADEGRLDDIHDGRMLQSDPIEWTAEYEAVIDEADRRAYARLKGVPRGMGFCFAYWAEKQNALYELGIEWVTPSTMNPGVMFD